MLKYWFVPMWVWVVFDLGFVSGLYYAFRVKQQ
jgi:hypothetical protein